MKVDLQNQYLKNYEGHTKTQKVIDDCHNFLLEQKTKFLGHKLKVSPVCVVTAEENQEIKKIGGSTPPDFTLDQFNRLFQLLMLGSSIEVSISAIPIKNTAGGNWGGRVCPITPTFSGFLTGESAKISGGQISFSNSTVTPLRTDFNLTATILATVNSTGSAYNSSLGRVQYGASFGATTNDSVGQTGTVLRMANTPDSTDSVLIVKDLISPVVAFLIGQSVAATYTWQL